jgi:hypothetical protein
VAVKVIVEVEVAGMAYVRLGVGVVVMVGVRVIVGVSKYTRVGGVRVTVPVMVTVAEVVGVLGVNWEIPLALQSRINPKQ